MADKSVAAPAVDQSSGPAAVAARFQRYCVQATGTVGGWRRIAILFGAGAISTLAHAPFFLWPVLFLTLPVLYWAIDASGTSPAIRPIPQAASAGFFFAFGYFFTGLYWIGEAFLVEAEIFAWALPFAVTLLPMAMAAYWALAASITRFAWTALGVAVDPTVTGAMQKILIMSVAFSSADLLRGHLFTGFPWHNPGLVLTTPLELLQVVSLIGMYGLAPFTFLIALVPIVTLAAAAATPGKSKSALIAIGLATVLPLASAYLWGAMRLAAPAAPDVAGVTLRVVQPSIPQRDKWRAEKQSEFFMRHLDLSKRDPAGRIDDLAGITHLIWPEASMPFGPLHNQQALDAIAAMLPDRVHLLAGVLRRGDPKIAPLPVHNSLAALDTTGRLVALYDKIHLVPFGEYLPFPSFLEGIGLQNLVRQRGGFAPGPMPKPPMIVEGLPPFAPVICYEAIFPGEIIQSGPRPGFILVVTNDGWFGRSIGPAQHFHQARVRAVEFGLPLVRAANNGISAVIDSEGRVRGKLDLDVVGSLDATLPGARPTTMFAVYGMSSAIMIKILFLFAFSMIRLCSSRRCAGSSAYIDLHVTGF